MSSTQICSVCSSFTDPDCRIHVPKLIPGVLLGCEGCRLLDTALRRFDGLLQVAAYLFWVSERALYVRVLDRQQRHLAVLELYTEPGKPCVLPLIGPARSVPEEPWGLKTSELAKSWLDECLSKHHICRGIDSPPLPTRVIDVGQSNEEVRLVVSGDLKAQYAALSHCWGGHRPLETTSTTLQDHLRAITLGTNSKTFADAVFVTRALGIRYLWIDSLCIIQDDKHDWAVEAGRMSQVYRNATITISAEAARSSYDGLFTSIEKRNSLQTDFSLFIRGHPSNLGITVPVHVRLRGLMRFDTGGLTHASRPTPVTELSNRAWVVQERLLSPRMLHFYAEELAWSCCSVSRCECKFDAGIAEQSVFKNLSDDAGAKLKTEYDLQRQWAGLVTNFSRKKLTYASDRLPAISGLAGLVKEHTHSSYFAGLWEFDIPYGLIWMSDHDRAGDNIITRFGPEIKVPSWSWASVIGPVLYLERHRTQFEHRTRTAEVKPLLEYVGATATPKGPNEFGDIENASVVVKGQLLPVKYDGDKKTWRPRQHSAKTEYGNKLEEAMTKFQELSISPFPEPTLEPKVIFDVLSEHPETLSDLEIQQADYYFLRAGIYITGGIFASETQENMCLLLKKPKTTIVKDAEGSVFTRVGQVLYGFHSRHVWALQPKETLTLI